MKTIDRTKVNRNSSENNQPFFRKSGSGSFQPKATRMPFFSADNLVTVQRSEEIDALTSEINGPATRVPNIQRVVEVRPPGRGEASAFDRRQELVTRLNALSAAIQYRLEGRAIRYRIVDAANLTHFDRQMQIFIDRAEVVPLRLITGAGYVQGPGGFQPLSLDSYVLGYLDLEDLLASDEHGFQARLLHVLTERFATRNYERRIGTAFTMAEFNRAHRAAHEAEAAHFQNVFSDPTIRFLYAEPRPNGTWVVGFRSDEGYHIFRVVRGAGRNVRGAQVWVRSRDRRRLTVDEFLNERRAAPAVAP